MKTLHIMILAAGGGTRMKSDVPKVLHPICGKPMIAYALDLAVATGVKQPIVILGEHAQHIQPHLPKEVKVVIQPKPQGTGDAVLMAKKALGSLTGDVLVLYADTPLLRRTTIQRLIETHHKSNATCTLLTTHLADPAGYGRIVRDAAGSITGILEEVEASVQQRTIREVNTGPLCINTQLLFEAVAQVPPRGAKQEVYLTTAIGILSQREGTKFQAVRVEEATEAMGVNSRVDLARATAVIRQRVIEHHLNNGVTIIAPEATYIDQAVSIGQDTTIYPGTVIESGVSIGKRCHIGPYARLRAGVDVDDDTRVGNFVELVRTTVGKRVHIHHVSYFGDTAIDDDVNIGAGTITANYDGTSKLQTTIGKGAFIGCDTILVAPVKVGPAAVTGAGAVIPKDHDVPARGVVVGVPARLLDRKAEKDGAPEPKAAPKPGANGQRPARAKPKPSHITLSRPPRVIRVARKQPIAKRRVAATPNKRSVARRRVAAQRRR